MRHTETIPVYCYTRHMASPQAKLADVTLLGAIAAWLGIYLSYHPFTNLLWTCNVGLLLGVPGIVMRSAWLVSIALLITVVPDVLWSVDVFFRLATGVHLIGGTEYLFDPAIPRWVRLMSWEHVVLPILLFLAVRRTGYVARAWPASVLVVLAVYYASFYLADPATEVNWVWGVFGDVQTFMPASAYPALASVVFSCVLSFPVHWLARRFVPQAPLPQRRQRDASHSS